jgi:hypothetical protein
MRHLKHFAMLLACAGLASLVFTLAAVWAPSAPVLANGDTVALSVNYGSSGVYNAYNPPSFPIVITLAQPFSSQENVTVSFSVDGALNALSTTATWNNGATTQTITYQPGASPFAVGTHTVVATFTNPETNVTTTSNSVSFTMHTVDAEWDCYVAASSSGVKAGKPAQIKLDLSGTSMPFDWTQERLTVTFSGPSTVTETNLQPDSSGLATFTAPTKVGTYGMTCSLSPTNTAYFTFSPVNQVSSDFAVRDMLPATVHIYTNPTTLTPNKPLEMYVVVKGVAGYPTPTADVRITFGLPNSPPQFTSQYLPLAADGTLLVTFKANSQIDKRYDIVVNYYGDLYYAPQSPTFTSTNPAIPGGAGSGSGQGGSSGSGNGNGTPAPGATQTSGTNTPTAATTGAQSNKITSNSVNAASASGWLIALLGGLGLLVVVGGGVVAFVILNRRRMNAEKLASWSASTPTNTTNWRQPPQALPPTGW